MRKFALILLSFILLFSLCLSGCGKTPTLFDYVYELREDVFEGESASYKLKCSYGFKTDENGEKIYALTFKLLDKEQDNATYSLDFTYGENELYKDFKFNPVTSTLTAVAEVENFTEKELTVKVSGASVSEEVILKSILPADTASAQTAINSLESSQTELINSYRDENGSFLGKISARVLVKNGKAYWYVGLYKPNGDLKAFLIDGKTLDVLAIRDIF